jgi:hypothetical protein
MRFFVATLLALFIVGTEAAEELHYGLRSRAVAKESKVSRGETKKLSTIAMGLRFRKRRDLSSVSIDGSNRFYSHPQLLRTLLLNILPLE